MFGHGARGTGQVRSRPFILRQQQIHEYNDERR
jgi:hypothetical protein